MLGVAEGTKEDKASWQNFLRHLAGRGLRGVRLFIADRCLGLVKSLGEFYPEAAYQRCAVHFYRNAWSQVPSTRVRPVAQMLNAIHAGEDREAARAKAQQIVAKLHELKLPAAAFFVQANVEETFSHFVIPSEHWRSLRTRFTSSEQIALASWGSASLRRLRRGRGVVVGVQRGMAATAASCSG